MMLLQETFRFGKFSILEVCVSVCDDDDDAVLGVITRVLDLVLISILWIYSIYKYNMTSYYTLPLS